jgi:hypothetical protein
VVELAQYLLFHLLVVVLVLYLWFRQLMAEFAALRLLFR